MKTTNAYTSGEQKCVPAVLVYGIFESTSTSEVLMIHKHSGTKNFHSGKWNGLGGKLEVGETPRQAALREFFEESGIQLQSAQLEERGAIYFPNFKPQAKEDWMVFIFVATISNSQKKNFNEKDSQNTASSASESLHWVDKASVLTLPLWPADQKFVAQILAGQTVNGTILYSNDAYQSQLRFFDQLL